MASLEEIKRKKLEELQQNQTQAQQQQLQEAINEQLKLQEQFNALEAIAKRYLSKEAISRYGNIKSAHPEKAIQVIALIAQLSQQGQIQEQVTDEQFKELLSRLDRPKREFKIQRK